MTVLSFQPFKSVILHPPASMISEKKHSHSNGHPLQVMGCFPPGVSKIFFFFICLNNLMIIYQRVFHLVYSVWNSWICKFISFPQIWEVFSYYFFKFFIVCFSYTVYPLLWDSCNTNIKPLPLNQDPWGSFQIFTLFLSLLRLGNFHQSGPSSDSPLLTSTLL